MMNRHSLTAIGAAGVVVLVACSSTTRPSEDPQRSSSADGLGTVAEPNGCGTFVGDADLPEQHGGMAPTFTGHLTESSAPQDGRFGPPFTGPDNAGWKPSSCDTPNPKATTQDFGRDVRYDVVYFKNWTDAVACISVFGHQNDPAPVASTLEFAAYVGGFEPSHIDVHNVGVGGGDIGSAAAHYAFAVPAHTDFEIVVSAEAPYASDGTKTANVDIEWQLQVSNCGEATKGDGGTSSGGSSSGGSSSGGSSSGGSSSGGSTSSSGGGSGDAGSSGGNTW